ncbi:prenyltransferase/squalene oxidase repeat-containing protein [Streptomyces sp. NPDC057798]|uniref:prenyltransferase/squalene oxidase repeat-containing protein n=1 Tax=Streptomyces sp. NPDC057798 TaxID=3346252 RepID=UPI0036C25DF4
MPRCVRRSRTARSARSPVTGGWCFSEGAHRWPVSDCTAEAVEALHDLPESGDGADWEAATRFLLARQNPDGGFGTYEARRGPKWLERLNPAEMFTDCMTESSYVECTGSAALALAQLRYRTDPALARRCADALNRARDFLLRAQGGDGSWPAWWGVHRIYGTLFAVRGLVATGLSLTHPALVAARRWLTDVQHSDGSWSELPASHPHSPYRPSSAGTPVSTAWALLALADLDAVGTPAARAGIAWLCARQHPDGSWPAQPPVGVFFGTAVLDYRLYAAYFPLWALGRHLPTAPIRVPGVNR